VPESNRHDFSLVFETSASTNSANWALIFLESGLQNYSFVLDWQKNMGSTLKIFCQTPVFYYICNPLIKGYEK
jgi:hypothetical protein